MPPNIAKAATPSDLPDVTSGWESFISRPPRKLNPESVTGRSFGTVISVPPKIDIQTTLVTSSSIWACWKSILVPPRSDIAQSFLPGFHGRLPKSEPPKTLMLNINPPFNSVKRAVKLLDILNILKVCIFGYLLVRLVLLQRCLLKGFHAEQESSDSSAPYGNIICNNRPGKRKHENE